MVSTLGFFTVSGRYGVIWSDFELVFSALVDILGVHVFFVTHSAVFIVCFGIDVVEVGD
jgi:hypothetical protein